MEIRLKRMGLKCAGIRTLILGLVILLFFAMARDFWDGGLSSIMVEIVIMLISLIAIVCNWIGALQGGPFRDIKRFCNQSDNPEAMMARLEQVRVSGIFRHENFVLDDEYLIYAKKMRAIVVPLKDVDEVYSEPMFTFTLRKHRFFIYYKDGLSIQRLVRADVAQHILELIKQHHPQIAIGEKASRVLKNVVGKINLRYHVMKVQERYFIIDSIRHGKLREYPFLGTICKFCANGTEHSWDAYEISEAELQNVKIKPIKEPMLTREIEMGLGFAMLFILIILNTLDIFDLIFDLPILPIVGGSWVLLLITTSLFVSFFLYLKKNSKFETKKHPKFRISQKANSRTKLESFLLVVGYTALVIGLFVALGHIIFIWNLSVFMYAFCLYCLVLLVLYNFMGKPPNIGSRSIIQKSEK